MTHPRFGPGFRAPHIADLTRADSLAPDWLELVSEHFLGVGGAQRRVLERIRERAPLLLHGVSLSIAGTDALDAEYLAGLRELADQLEPLHVSDHLCWTSLGGRQSHDLLPVARTRAVLDHVVSRVQQVQESLGRPMLLENATVYVAFRADELSEPAFLRELCARTGCGVLLDVNNLYVNRENLGIDPYEYLEVLPRAAVGYLHVAGHAVLPDVRIDTHAAEVPDPVWELYEATVRRFPEAGVILERDDRIPAYAELCRELDVARERHRRALASSLPVPAPVRRELVSSAASDSDWPALQRAFWQRSEAPFAGDRTVSAARGLRVYGDAQRENLRRALASNFPALAKVLTSGDFAALAAAYVESHPPAGHDYRSLGAELASFLRTHTLQAEYGVPAEALADLAALEQAQLEVAEERDEPAVPPQILAALEPEKWPDTRFRLARALRLVPASHDVLPAVEAVARGEAPPLAEPSPATYLVTRSDGKLRSERLDPAAAALYESFFAGATFAEACRDDLDLARTAARILVELSARGLLCALG
jgi:hypothetical protein